MTENPALLLAFVYFDQSHTGYLLDKDAEEVLHTMGLHLSRSQVKLPCQLMLGSIIRAIYFARFKY